MTTINSVLILDEHGDPLLTRNYSNSVVTRSTFEQLRNHIIAGSIPAPVFSIQPYFFVHRRCDTLHFFATLPLTANVMAATTLLEAIYRVISTFINSANAATLQPILSTSADNSGVTAVTSDNIKKHMILIHELLDEMIDNGVPQTSDPEVLRLFVQTKKFKEGKKKDKEDKIKEKITVQATGVNTHRRPGIVYSSNEIFIDIIERCSVLVSASGNILHSDVSGTVQINSKLSGMPECTFGFNNRLLGTTTTGNNKRTVSEADNFSQFTTFNNCVRLSSLKQFNLSKAITFIPPDGKFELMNYRIIEQVRIPFTVRPMVVLHGRNRLELKLFIKAEYGTDVTGNKVLISIPTPPNVSTVDSTPSIGKAKLRKDGAAIEWRIKNFNGATSANCNFMINCIGLVSESNNDLRDWKRPPITMQFEIPVYTSSGLQVRYMTISEQSNYPVLKWLRSVTVADNYAIRW